MRFRPVVRAIVVVATLTAGCGAGSNSPATVAETINASVAAVRARDGKAFVRYWTDRGLAASGAGSREQTRRGTKLDFASGAIAIQRLKVLKVHGNRASAEADVIVRFFRPWTPILRFKYRLVRSDHLWKIDGLDYLWGAPVPRGEPILAIKAREFSFGIPSTVVPSRVALTLENVGTEEHKIALFKGPNGVDVATAKRALENISQWDPLRSAPDGYTGTSEDLIAALPGQTHTLSFRDPLPTGTYALVCYAPQGGYDAPGAATAKTHAQLGMVSVLTVRD